MRKTCFTVLLLVVSIYPQAAQTNKLTGKWSVVDQTNEMGQRQQALVLVGVVVGDEDKGAILTLQKGKNFALYFGLALTIPAKREGSVNIRFDQAEAQPHFWHLSEDDTTTAIMPADDLLERMEHAETFRLQYNDVSGLYVILRFDVKGFQAAKNKLINTR